MRNIKRVSLYTVRWAGGVDWHWHTSINSIRGLLCKSHTYTIVVIKAIASAAHLEIPFRMRWWWLVATESQVSLELFPFSPSLDLHSTCPPKQTVPTRQLATTASWHCEYCTLYRGVAPPDPTPLVFTSRSIDCSSMPCLWGNFLTNEP